MSPVRLGWPMLRMNYLLELERDDVYKLSREPTASGTTRGETVKHTEGERVNFCIYQFLRSS
jgi:hypothetical protein